MSDLIDEVRICSNVRDNIISKVFYLRKPSVRGCVNVFFDQRLSANFPSWPIEGLPFQIIIWNIIVVGFAPV